MAKLRLNYPNIEDEKGNLHSIADASLYLTFGYWIYLVPQYKPNSVLMLGYGGGTTARYINLFYGDVPITAVDTSDVSEFILPNVTLIQESAESYVKRNVTFDAVIVDIYDTNDSHPPAFVFSSEFAERLGHIANYIILHAVRDDDISAYKYNKIRTLGTGRSDKLAPKIHYYMVNNIESLPIR